jgi:hypothetical protein
MVFTCVALLRKYYVRLFFKRNGEIWVLGGLKRV